ncbi:MAG: hypothetical protein ABUL60_26435 [Myxococcales bacterium]
MRFRLQDIGPIGFACGFVLVACTVGDPAGPSGSGGSSGSSGSSSAGMASAGTASSGSGSGTGGSATGTAGSSSAGTGTGGVSDGNAGSNSGSGTGASSAGTGTGGATAGTGTGGGGGAGGAGNKSKTTFFVTSDTSKTGKLGGLTGADKRCQDLAVAAGFGDHTFHAYLSTATVNAKDRIGKGPWVNAKGLTVAADVASLHSAATKGDHTIFIDETGMPIHGQWDGGPVEHDVLTGSMPDGTVQAGKTCQDWTSDAQADTAWVGHSDGMGPNMATTGTYTSWNSSHENGGCNDTAPKGGAGRLYCFAID